MAQKKDFGVEKPNFTPKQFLIKAQSFTSGKWKKVGKFGSLPRLKIALAMIIKLIYFAT